MSHILVVDDDESHRTLLSDFLETLGYQTRQAKDGREALDMLDEVLARRRIRPGSLSYGRDPARDRGYLQVAQLAMLRRARNKAGSG